jgi:hypothetical protein
MSQFLGSKSGGITSASKIENRAVFLHRAGGDMRLSARTGSKAMSAQEYRGT